MNKLFFIVFLLSSSVCAQDLKEDLAHQLEEMGQELQKVQDERGSEEAHQKLVGDVRVILPILIQKGQSHIDSLSEKEVQECLTEIKKNWVGLESEEDLLLISDRSLAAKEKIKILYKKSLEANYEDDLEVLKKEAFNVGYQKVFQDLAQEVRSRGYGYTGPNPNWRAILLLSSVLLVYAVVPPPVSAYLATTILGVLAYLEVRDFYQRLDEEESIYFSPPRREPNRKVIPYP